MLDLNPSATVAVWGLAYKENTNSIKNSPSLATISQLPETTLRLHDPEVSAAEVVKNPNAVCCATPLEAAKGADALMILTPWAEYREVSLESLIMTMRGRIVIDPFKILHFADAKEFGFSIHSLGSRAKDLRINC